ncbi:MAG: motility associated factor glycosyltransferase family protein [Parachlamydiaceae bacterium]|nr:motility associated factor glycosyltransferase family protein [Parachlamydiaceae bacterium]
MNYIEKHHDLYNNNLNILRHKDPLVAYKLELIHEFNQIQFCETQQNELNLSRYRFGITDYYHSPDGAFEEAKKTVENEIEPKTEAIFFYGLGLAYIYDALKEWLKKNPKRHLIILEDDLEVINSFLYTERAGELLQDAQATIFTFEDLYEYDKFFKLNSRFLHLKIQFLTLPYYILKREKESFDLCYRILYDHNWVKHIHEEYMSGQAGFLKNLYPDLLQLPESYLATGLYNKFTNIPAIICGAGPSLEKNIELLKTLTDRALIFAGGSSMNVVNSYGLIPHFGIGIDPNPEQCHRLITNHCFHTPFFYRHRLSEQAFELIQGSRIYVPGSHSTFSSFMEEKLGISHPPLDEGHNVVTFCTEIARHLGCNPIIYVGMDLAFTEVKTYAQGIGTHPLWLGISKPYEQQESHVVSRVGIDGQKITTKWDWLGEANWFTHYSIAHPEIQILNATEGGLGFNFVPNWTLEKVADEILTQTYDLSSKIKGEIQNSQIPVTKLNIIELIQEIKKSLLTSIEYCNTIISEEYKLLVNNSDADKKSLFTTKAILFESLLHDELAYEYFLKDFENARSSLEASTGKPTEFEAQVKQLISRFQFLSAVLSQHVNILQKSMVKFIFFKTSTETTINTKKSTIYQEGDKYKFEKDHLILKDAELNLNFDIEFKSTEKTDYYPSDKLKIQSYYDNKRNLQGPSRFYSESGTLLAEHWFVKGQKQGKSSSYYYFGGLQSLERYKDNQLHGKQEYYFKNGTPHILLEYNNGLLNGKVSIFNNEGFLIRELNYKNGKRHGKEQMWNEKKNCIIECEYNDGIPVNAAYEWSSNGKLIKEITINHYPDDFDASFWNESGELLQSFKKGSEDFSIYYDERQKQAELLGDALENVEKNIDSLLLGSTDKTELDPQLRSEFLTMKNSIRELQNMKLELRSIKEASEKLAIIPSAIPEKM